MPLLPDSIRELIALLAKLGKPQRIILFGSRTKGTYRANSDFDLCVVGRRCSELVWNRLLIDIDEAPITLFPVDIVELESAPSALREEIEAHGKIVYDAH